jgi:hypothetical protein
MLSKEMLRTQSLVLRYWQETQRSSVPTESALRARQRSPGADRAGLALVRHRFSDGGSEVALPGRWTSINVTLKKTVDWVELKLSRSQISNPSLAREPVSKI